MMNNLNQSLQNSEYYRVMEKRIRYYSNKYDPHTIFFEQPHIFVENTSVVKRKKGISTLITIFMNIF